MKPTARQHSVTDAEIRSVIEHFITRYPINAAFDPTANAYMYVGRIGGEPWIEVATEETARVEVFHAMLLTKAVAEDLFRISRGSLDLRGMLSGQRPYVGPQTEPIDWPLG
ncbi:hypothetical protein [Mycolicibacterium austroafricanum]|uniref:hypothetical protein n=1 Tax=Mycolicibacterium austroafricanum TaxID=39687 RepID=UPI000A5F4D2D|nr:hypothetical protein [Mycolicibacterium austroafricanum]